MSTNKIIVLEGLPATGKTTLADSFKRNVITIPEIVLNRHGEEQEGELFYFRNDLEKIRIARKQQLPVLVERSYFTTLAHNYSRLILDGSLDFFKILEAFAKNKARENLTPDLYIFLDIGVDLSLTRKNRAIDQQNIWTQEKYLKVIHEFYKYCFDLLEPDVPYVKIDGRLSIDDLYKNVEKYLYE